MEEMNFQRERSCGGLIPSTRLSRHVSNFLPDGLNRLRPGPSAMFQSGIEPPPLSGPLANSGGGQSKSRSSGLDLCDQLFCFCLHAAHASVKFHTGQVETSHSPAVPRGGISLTMDQNETFRENLLAALAESGMTEAELSVAAGLNRRAVTDIRERRTMSPKISTVFALARALHRDPGELLGIGQRYRLDRQLAEFLEQFGPEDQARFLAALTALPRPRGE